MLHRFDCFLGRAPRRDLLGPMLVCLGVLMATPGVATPGVATPFVATPFVATQAPGIVASTVLLRATVRLEPPRSARVDLPRLGGKDAPAMLRIVATTQRDPSQRDPAQGEPLPGLALHLRLEHDAGAVRRFDHPADRHARGLVRLPTASVEHASLVLQAAVPGIAELVVEAVPEADDGPAARAERSWTRGCAAWGADDPALRRRSIGHFRDAAGAWRAAGDLPATARALLAAGAAAAWLGEPDAAALLETADREAARMAPAPEALALRGAVLDDLGLLAYRRGALDEASARFEQALAVRRAAGDPLGAAETLSNAALVDQLRGDAEAARRGYEAGLGIARRHGDRRLEASLTQNLATLEHEAGALDAAVAAYERAIELGDSLGEAPRSATAWSNLAVALRTLGRLDAARARFADALTIQEQLGDARGRGATLNSLGQLDLMLGEPSRALEHLEQSLRLRQAADDRRGLAATLHNLGMAERELGRLARAEALLRRALRIRAELGDRRGRGASRHELAETLRRRGALDAALESVERALSFREEHDPLRAADSQRLRAEILLDRAELNAGLAVGRPAELPADLPADLSAALSAALSDALEAQHAAGADEPAARTLGARARVAALDGDFARAVVDLEAALERLHRLRLTVRSPARRATFLAVRRPLVEQLIEAHRALAAQADEPQGGHGIDHAARAFEVAERARARSLLDRLEESLDRPLEQTTATRPEPANNDGDGARTPLRAAAARALLDDDTALLSLFVGARGSVLWVLTRDSLTMHELPDAARLEALAADALAQWSTLEVGAAPPPDGSAGADDAATRLARLVLAPAEATLRRHHRWVVVADGALAALPFAALPFAGQPVVQHHEVIQLPSAAMLAARRARETVPGEGPDLVLFGDPLGGDRLPATRREAEAIVALFGDRPTKLALGAQATREAALSGLLDDARRIHFATHGRLDAERPSRSALILSSVDAAGRRVEPALRPADLETLRLDAELVVLSGCSTAAGRAVLGEGVFGLPRAFLRAGARSVVASLWPVADGPTAALMTRFYRALLADGLAPPAALRRAQVGLRTETRWRHPSYWAAFLVTGDWLIDDRPRGDRL